MLATDVGDNAVYLVDGKTGWLARKDDNEDIKAKLIGAIRTNEVQRRAFGEAARKRLKDLGMSIQNTVRRHEELYERLAAK